jgi:uncharacterized protein (PEP-CTERM system associated)
MTIDPFPRSVVACATARLRRLACAQGLIAIVAAALLPDPAAAQAAPPAPVIDSGVVGGAKPAATDAPLPADDIVPVRTSGLTFGANLQALFSDNFILADESSEASGRSLELTPYVEGFLRTAKSRGSMALRLRGLWYDTNGRDDTSLSPDVRANGDFSISGDQLRIAGSSYVFREAPSPFSAVPVDPAGRDVGTNLYRDYQVSPYSLGRLFGADYELRYRASSTDPGGITPGSVGQQVAGGLASSRDAPGSLAWSANADVERIDFEDDSDLTRSMAEGLVYYRFMPTLRVGAGVQYQHVDVLRDADGDDSGVGPVVAVSWRPTRRTLLSARYADTFYGSESSIAFTHRRARWLFGVNYVKNLQAGSRSSLLYLDPDRIFALDDPSAAQGAEVVRSLAERRVSSGAGRELAFGQTGSRLVFAENLVVSLALSRPRNTLALSLFQNDQEPANSSLITATEFDLVQRGITLDGDHRLTQSSAIFMSAQYSQSESDQTGQDSRLASLAIGWRTSLSRHAAIALTARTTRQTSEGSTPSNEYREQALIAAIDYRF